ncbi:SDR family oxidoreductase [Ureibacillus terrenus]|uniref:SDR family oxidoreductase n=1 Tax=Ureibacillus terrenus TaxID=118246 RepID=A0A540V1E7_9BACL|nr:SDR family oxidoreductase [Ureibacillus terrenus]TQE90546.1 SDR family oxidoreductase [Ureibacillus terrenus]
MKYLVTSATGDLAGRAVKHLKNFVPVSDIVVTVRSEEKAKAFRDQGLEVRIADFLDKPSLVEAFQGINRVLFVSSNDLATRKQQHQNVVEALKEAGVEYVVYMSAPNAQNSTLVVAPDHKFTEQLIMESGMDYGFARNNWYLENEVFMLKAVKNGAPLTYSAGDGRVCYALKEDYAEAAARILAGVAPKQSIYELGGEPITYEQLAQIAERALGREVKTNPVSDEEFVNTLVELGLPKEAAQFSVIVQKDIRNGLLDVPSDDLEKVLGRKPAPFDEFIRSI